jgi:hypothetical protein
LRDTSFVIVSICTRSGRWWFACSKTMMGISNLSLFLSYEYHHPDSLNLSLLLSYEYHHPYSLQLTNGKEGSKQHFWESMV